MAAPMAQRCARPAGQFHPAFVGLAPEWEPTARLGLPPTMASISSKMVAF